jgi:nucleoid-associated protein YgaU
MTSRYHDRKGNVSKFNTTVYKPVDRAMSEELDGKNSDVYLLAQEGDRLDNLANEFYGDPSLWWFIARINHLNSINVPVGTSLRLPVTLEDATSE